MFTKLQTVHRIYFTSACFLCCFWSMMAQNNGLVDSLIQLPEIEVVQNRLSTYAIGANVQQIDSNQLQLYPMQNLVTALSGEGAIYIKNYGPGRLATTSLRGASSSQTAIVWNGIPLVQAMLGQFDLALFPAFFMDQVAIQPGGGSSLWGSGAIGGSIHLNHSNSFNQKWQLNGQSSIGSFQHFNNGLKIHYSNKKWSSTTRGFYETAKNDFTFVDNNGSKKQLPHANIKQKGILQENAFRINAQQQLNFRLWWQHTDREIPPIIGQSLSAAQQKDQALRAILDWKLTRKQSVWKISTAIFDEQLDYQDSLSNIDSKSRARTTQFLLEWTTYLGNKWQINVNAQHRYLWANSTAYVETKTQHQTALYSALKWLPTTKWTAVLSLRQEWLDGSSVPFVPSLGFEGQLGKYFWLKGNVSRNFRSPTFNDLYWSPGGNPDLKAERGWSEELTLGFQPLKRNWSTDVTFYNRNIQNWIIWLPGSNFWSPKNVLEVWSRGLEFKFNSSFEFQKIVGKLSGQYHFTLSSNQKARTANDVSVGKQLIYQPKHQAQVRASFAWQKFNLTYVHAYTGKAYILADHSAALPAYQIGDFYFSRDFSSAAWNAKIQFGIRNVWNKNYQSVVSRPMPGRYFELGTSIYFKPKKNNQT